MSILAKNWTGCLLITNPTLIPMTWNISSKNCMYMRKSYQRVSHNIQVDTNIFSISWINIMQYCRTKQQKQMRVWLGHNFNMIRYNLKHLSKKETENIYVSYFYYLQRSTFCNKTINNVDQGSTNYGQQAKCGFNLSSRPMMYQPFEFKSQFFITSQQTAEQTLRSHCFWHFFNSLGFCKSYEFFAHT